MESDTYLRVRPTELYLGSDTTHGVLRMHVFYDGNVYKDALVKEWLDEVRAATLWYLFYSYRRRSKSLSKLIEMLKSSLSFVYDSSSDTV